MHWFSFSSSRHNAGEVRVQKCSFLDFLQALQRLSVSACNESTTRLCSTSSGAFYSSDFYQCPLILARMFLCVLVLGRWRSVPQLAVLGWGSKVLSNGHQSLFLSKWLYGCLRLFLSECSQSLLLKVHCSSFIGPTLGAKVCHLLYLTQQPVTNWVIYTGLALGRARDLHYLRGRQQCSWVFIRALDL